MPKLLTREEFKAAVFKRDKNKCLFCDKPAIDAHHIIERDLWPDYGFYLENGASVCEEHHLACEMTTISVEEIRAAAKITVILLPPQLSPDKKYDKWGNEVLPDGTRLQGPMFHREGTRKILKRGNMLRLFDGFY